MAADEGTPAVREEAAGEEKPVRLRFRRRQRLGHNREFQAVYAAKVRKARGPIAVFGAPNALGHSRLGLSVGRQVGGAVVRNRVKRLLREAFRLEQAGAGGGVPAGLDLVVTVRPHRTMPLAAYRRVLVELSREVEREWARRARRAELGGAGGQGRGEGEEGSG